MSGEQWGEAVEAVVRLFDSQEGSYLLTKNWIDVDDIRLAIAKAAPLIVADTRRKVAEEIEATFAANARSELDRPKVERGGFLGDREWAVAIARGSGNGDSGQEET